VNELVLKQQLSVIHPIGWRDAAAARVNGR